MMLIKADRTKMFTQGYYWCTACGTINIARARH